MALFTNLLLCTFVCATLHGFASCTPAKRSIDAICQGTECTETTDEVVVTEYPVEEECDVDPGLERRTILLEQAATTWGATLPPMLDRLSEISNSLQKPAPVIEPKGMDCTDLFEQGQTTNGIYKIGYHEHSITPHEPFYAYCDMVTDGGGWTVFQRRFQGTTDFYRGWDAYVAGFGHLNSDYWLGLDRVYLLTSLANYELRVDITDVHDHVLFAKYEIFNISDSVDNYKLGISGYSGDAHDGLSMHDGQPFTTKDSDNDNYDTNCAVQYTGAWWYHGNIDRPTWLAPHVCFGSNLNGLYQSVARPSMQWMGWPPLSMSEMKIRRKN